MFGQDDKHVEEAASEFTGCVSGIFRLIFMSRFSIMLWDYSASYCLPWSWQYKQLGKDSSPCRFCQTEVPHLGSWACTQCEFKFHGNGFARCENCLQKAWWIDCPTCGASHRPR